MRLGLTCGQLQRTLSYNSTTPEDEIGNAVGWSASGSKMASSKPLDFPQGSWKAQLLATLGTLDIDPDIRPYNPGQLNSDDQSVFCKNILLKDRKSQFYLLTFQEDKTLDLKQLKKDLNAHRNFSFASNEELLKLVGCQSGAVSPFGLMCDAVQHVKFVLDQDLFQSKEPLNFHPFEATESLIMTSEGLQKFFKHIKRQIHTFKC